MLGLRRRIALTGLVATAIALLALLLLVGPALRSRALEQERTTLLAEARLLARIVREPLARGAGSGELDALVDDAAREVRARITLVAPDGKVLADSAVSGKELHALEGHRDRPEVRNALSAGSGTAERRSATVDEELLYAAVAVQDGPRVLGVCRVALSVAGIEARTSDLRRALAVALVLAFVITAVLSAAFAASFARPLEQMMAAARRLAGGDLSVRLHARHSDELAVLAGLLNRTMDQLEERLAETSRERARNDAVLSAMDDGVLAVDHRGVVLLANDALRHNLDLADPVGRHYVEAIRQRDVGELIEAVLRTGEHHAAEVELPRRDRAFALTAVPFPGAEGVPHGAVLAFHDVTARRRLERVRRDFVANASHELRTPLTSVRGFVEALEDGALDDPQRARRFLGKIRTHADRMAALIDDLLELSRLESGERPPRWEPVQPAAVVEEVVASFAERARRRHIGLTVTDRGAPVVVSDGERLWRVIENLVDNAVKYTAEGGHVELILSPGSDGGALVEVRDDGPGIPQEHLGRIFERFYRVDKARSRELGGTGLGLSIVKHLAEGMGATVAATSELGSGSCFSVSIPAGRDRTLATASDD